MDDMRTFELRLGSGLDQLAGPRRPVDAVAISRSVIATSTSPRRRFQSMFSTTKFLVAGATVALFGGFLLSSVLTLPSDERVPPVGASASATTPAEPTDAATSEPEPTAEAEGDTTTSDLLSGVDVVAEEVEPGFLRVLSDGVRDLTQGRTARIVHGQDESVWIFRDKEFFRLGDTVTHEWPKDTKRYLNGVNSQDIAVGPDGVVWWADFKGKGLWSFDGQAWSLRRKKPAGADARLDEVEVLSDGTVLASWRGDAEHGGTERKLARLGPDGWEVLAEIGEPNARAILHADDMDDIWLVLHGQEFVIRTLYRGSFPEGAEGVLRQVQLPSETISGIEFLPDGTVVAQSFLAGPFLALDGTTWTERSGPDGIPESGMLVAATPDGSLWYVSCGEVDPLRGCDLVYSDGRAISRFELGDIDGWESAVASDGKLWLVLDGAEGDGLYVTTPKAVTSSE